MMANRDALLFAICVSCVPRHVGPGLHVDSRKPASFAGGRVRDGDRDLDRFRRHSRHPEIAPRRARFAVADPPPTGWFDWQISASQSTMCDAKSAIRPLAHGVQSLEPPVRARARHASTGYALRPILPRGEAGGARAASIGDRVRCSNRRRPPASRVPRLRRLQASLFG